MSHFVGLVFGNNVDQQLAPYDENLRVEFQDNTDEYKEKYETGTYKEYKRVVENGFESYTNQVLSETPFKEKYATFEKFCEEYIEAEKNEEGRWGYMHNGKAKWDWYQVGGRWQGYLKRKPMDQCKFPQLMDEGKPGVFGTGYSEGFDRVDVCALCDIDWEGMKQERIDRAAAEWDKALKEVEDGSKTEKEAFMWMNWGRTREQGRIPRQEHIDSNASVTPYCIILEGEWYQKGEMGWWGISTDEMSCEEWSKKVELLMDELPEDTLVTVIDFHI